MLSRVPPQPQYTESDLYESLQPLPSWLPIVGGRVRLGETIDLAIMVKYCQEANAL